VPPDGGGANMEAEVEDITAAIRRVLPPAWLSGANVVERTSSGGLVSDGTESGTAVTAREGGCSAAPTAAWLIEGSYGDAPLPPSLLPLDLRLEHHLSYDSSLYNLMEAAREALLTPQQCLEGVPLSDLHTLPVDDRPASCTPPILWKARVAAGTVQQCDRAEAKAQRKWWAKHPGRRALQAQYHDFVRGVIAPHICKSMGDDRLDIVYQGLPTLRVVFPATPAAADVTPCIPHRDADYRHQPEEVNFWCPLTRVRGTGSLYVESRPGIADWHPFEAAAPDDTHGHCIVFWGNQCR